MLKKIALGLLALVALVAIAAVVIVRSKTATFDENVAKVYDIAPLDITAAEPPGDPPSPAPEEADEATVLAASEAMARYEEAVAGHKAVLARGEHLAVGLGACNDCHSPDYSGREEVMGPLGTIRMPNISPGEGNKITQYTEGELARLLRHGVKKDGTSAVFMPSQDFAWWPDDDIRALITFIRTVPPVDKTWEPTELGPIAKVLDLSDSLVLDVARRIDHESTDKAPPPAATAAYGGYVARICQGCHGKTLSGGKIPGTPPDIPIPANLTPHESGIGHYAFADFDKLMREGVKPDGSALDSFMPIASFKNFDETEMKALWAYLESLPKKAFGGR